MRSVSCIAEPFPSTSSLRGPAALLALGGDLPLHRLRRRLAPVGGSARGVSQPAGSSLGPVCSHPRGPDSPSSMKTLVELDRGAPPRATVCLCYFVSLLSLGSSLPLQCTPPASIRPPVSELIRTELFLRGFSFADQPLHPVNHSCPLPGNLI